MTNKSNNKEVQRIKASQDELIRWLESDLWALIADESSGLSDLKSFSRNLTHKKSRKELTKHNLRLIKEDYKMEDWLILNREIEMENIFDLKLYETILNLHLLQIEIVWSLSIFGMTLKGELNY